MIESIASLATCVEPLAVKLHTFALDGGGNWFSLQLIAQRGAAVIDGLMGEDFEVASQIFACARFATGARSVGIPIVGGNPGGLHVAESPLQKPT
jgi:hypothetical protein